MVSEGVGRKAGKTPGNRAVLPVGFFNRPVSEVAEGLLGKCLACRMPGKTQRMLLTEVEAYDGTGDLACHASKGKTKRTEVMFGEPGHLYVYLCYGVHWMLNIVTGPPGYPAAVLIRGAGAVNGPGRLTKNLGITGALNARPLGRKTGLWIEDRGSVVTRGDILRTPRIGVDYAGPVWAAKPYRFVWTKVHSGGRA